MRVLALPGGGFKTAFQLKIIEHLLQEEPWDLIVGISGGSINGCLAAQKDIQLMMDLWEGINDKCSLFGIGGFLAFDLWRGKALYSLKPVEKKLKEHVSLSKLKIPFGAGVTIRATREYRTIWSKDCKTDEELHNSILGSSAICGFMDGKTMKIDGKDHILQDGGHAKIIPRFPLEATHVTVVFSDAITQEKVRETQIKNNLISNIEWSMDVLEDNRRIDEVFWLKQMAETREIRIFAPETPIGGRFEASREIIRRRMKLGEEALKHPLIFDGKGQLNEC